MVADVASGVAWVLAAVPALGGDGARVTLVGQSCGAQLGALVEVVDETHRVSPCA